MQHERDTADQGLLMVEPINSAKHVEFTGGLLLNLQGLELLVRAFLHHKSGSSFGFPLEGEAEVEETLMPSYAALGKMVEDFNSQLTKSEQSYKINYVPVKLRDAFAHGRILTQSGFPLTLWKFGKPKNGKVPVEININMTAEWLAVANHQVVTETEKVIRLAIARGYQGFS